jgi:GT2 family glycosyltransferase
MKASLGDWQAVRTINRSGLFDKTWYNKTNPDVATSGLDPVRHYVEFGAREGRDPSPSFNSREYLASYGDAAAIRVNPLLHFISEKRLGAHAAHERRNIFSLDAIIILPKLLNAPNIGKAMAYLRSGQLRHLRARTRDILITELVANAGKRAKHVSRTNLRNRNAQLLPMPGYLTLHPELETGPKRQLDSSISVIIPTYNGGTEFYLLIRKLKQQKGLRAIEIVAVDSGSEDGTDTMAETLGCKVIRIPSKQFSHSSSRNLGAANATGDLLLFMVQDAYPIGDYWLYGLASCLLQPHEGVTLAALSSTEYSRNDSDLLYDVLIDVHYKFLRCRNCDHMGSFVGDTQIELRTEGQLSDIACLIYRNIFQEFKFEGRYAEDLTLGIRLIRAGHRVAMLSSIPVIHSHRRSAGYHLRRVFVDVTFLSEVFSDLAVTPLFSVRGTLAAAFALRDALPRIAASLTMSPSEALELAIKSLQDFALPTTTTNFAGRGDFGYPPLGPWIDRIAKNTHDIAQGSVEQSMSHLKGMLLGRLHGVKLFLSTVYPALDKQLALEIDDTIEKTLAMALGAQLGFHYVTAMSGSRLDAAPELIVELSSLLIEGI